VQPQVGPSLGPNNRRPGRAQREPRPTTRHEAERLHFVTRCLASGTRKLGRIHHSAHDFKQPTSFPRRISAPGVCNFASPTRIEGWAERRETFGCVRNTRWACHLASKTRVNALMTRHARRLRGALRPMTQQYMGRNNVTISMPDGGSVPIVSQTEIDPMKIALSLMLAPRHDDGAHRAAARAEAARARAARARTPTSRAAHSARRHWVLRTPSPSRATALARRDGLRRAPTACEMAAPGSSFALASFSLVEGHAVPPGCRPVILASVRPRRG